MPTVRISPITDAQYFDNNGDPLSGGKLFFYQGGSFSVQKTTYSNSAGTTPNTNPIVLDSSGRPTVSAFLVVNEPYNVQLTAPDGTTVLNSWVNLQVSTGGVNQIVAGTNVTISPVGGTGTVTINATGGGGGTPASPTNSVQYNNSGSFGGSADFIYDNTNTTVTLGATGATGSLMFDGTDSSINTIEDINLYPGATGVVRVGQPGDAGVIDSNIGNTLTITGDTGLTLASNSNDIVMSLDSTTTPKVSITGPTASNYATGLTDNDLTNKYYVDTAISGGGSNLLTPVLTSVDYTTILSSNESMIVLDAPTNPITTITIDGSLAYDPGTTITFYNNSTQTMLIALSTGTMTQVQSGFTGTRTLTAFGMATAIKVKNAGNNWTINGAGLA